MASEKIRDASAPARLDQPSFFQNWERRTNSGTRSDGPNESRFSSESSHASPKSTVPPPRSRGLRRTVVECSRTAPAGAIPELAIPTNVHLEVRRRSNNAEPSAESSASQQGRQNHSGDITRQQGSTVRAGTESKKSSISSMTSRLRTHLRSSLTDFRTPEFRISNSARELNQPQEERLGSEWTKASPKDEWVEGLISKSGIMQRRTKSAGPLPSPIVPLRPPAPRSVTGSGYQHTVRLETSFAKLRRNTLLEKPEQPVAIPRLSIAARTKSVIAKRVRFALHHRNSAKDDVNQKHLPPTLLGKSRRPARNKTSESLQRVTSILHFMVAEMPSHTNSDRSNQSCELALPERFKHSNRKGTFHLPAVIRNRLRKSTNVSYTSSIRHMREGPTPVNTPEPRETYRVKRSPSADTEEFFKIDISVRGGTSYLPSEATRINTPPLPGDGPGKKRMPFFFDYTAPSAVETPAKEDSPIEKEEPPLSPDVRPRRGRTVGGTDWYETQLAVVDAVGDGGSLSREASEATQLDEEKAVADLNVPEHLPSSPLCPRHEKHKSGGKGVCWMHGRNRYGKKGQQ